MRVLVTGNQGRIGVEIERQLRAEGHSVVGFDRELGQDIRNAKAVRAAASGCEAVIHLASLLGRPEDDPDEIMSVSLLGTWHVLSAAKENAMQRVVYFSSVNAMGIFMGEKAPDYLPFDEDHPARPGRAYGMSKKLCEEMCRHFTDETGIATICLRPPAVFMSDSYARVRARWAQHGEPERWPVWEYGAFADVTDVARAAILSLTCPDPGHVVLLLCADDIVSPELPSRELARRILPDVPWRGGPEYDSEPFRALVDARRARDVLGWQPSVRWRTPEVE